MNVMFVVSFVLLFVPMFDSWLMPCNPLKSRNCKVSEWSSWSACTASCDTNTEGKQTKTRTKTQDKYCLGIACGKLFEERTCNRVCCPVNCVYSWGAWSSCKGCGTNGQQTSLPVLSQNAKCGGTCVKTDRKRTCDAGK